MMEGLATPPAAARKTTMIDATYLKAQWPLVDHSGCWNNPSRVRQNSIAKLKASRNLGTIDCATSGRSGRLYPSAESKASTSESGRNILSFCAGRDANP